MYDMIWSPRPVYTSFAIAARATLPLCPMPPGAFRTCGFWPWCPSGVWIGLVSGNQGIEVPDGARHAGDQGLGGRVHGLGNSDGQACAQHLVFHRLDQADQRCPFPAAVLNEGGIVGIWHEMNPSLSPKPLQSQKNRNGNSASAGAP